MNILSFSSVDLLETALIEQICARLQNAIDKKNQATLIVSGGKTPLNLFKKLSQIELDWEKVIISLVDERWVENKNDASNERLVRENLLQHKAKKAKFVPFRFEANSIEDGTKIAEKNFVEQITFPLDVIILGMGEDGHTASLFPFAKNLNAGLDLLSGKTLINITPLDAPHDRITLTLPAILNSNAIFLHITGSKKREVLAKAESGTNVQEMPIRAILKQNKTDLTIFWAP